MQKTRFKMTTLSVSAYMAMIMNDTALSATTKSEFNFEAAFWSLLSQSNFRVPGFLTEVRSPHISTYIFICCHDILYCDLYGTRSSYLWLLRISLFVRLLFYNNHSFKNSLFGSYCAVKILTCENSRHFAKPPLVSPRNDAWETTAGIPYWWRHFGIRWIAKNNHI